MENSTMYRQGDFLLIKTHEAVPSDAKPEPRDSRNRVVVGEGEVTGHAHAIVETDVAIYELDGKRWLVANEPCNLVHEDHATIAIDIGTWLLVPQRQFDTASGLVQRVRD